MTPFLVIICTEPDPDREIRQGGGGGLGHPDPEIRRGGGSPKRFLRPFGPQVWSKNKGRPLPWIHHCCSFEFHFIFLPFARFLVYLGLIAL